jgi:hypothetical protein
MTAPPQDIPGRLADLLPVPLREIPATAPVAMAWAVQRVLPPAVPLRRGMAFSSGI